MKTTTDVLSATLQDAFELATWNQPRSLTQLRAFVSARDEALDVEDFDL
jgi:hypothetical protein